MYDGGEGRALVCDRKERPPQLRHGFVKHTAFDLAGCFRFRKSLGHDKNRQKAHANEPVVLPPAQARCQLLELLIFFGGGAGGAHRLSMPRLPRVMYTGYALRPVLVMLVLSDAHTTGQIHVPQGSCCFNSSSQSALHREEISRSPVLVYLSIFVGEVFSTS